MRKLVCGLLVGLSACGTPSQSSPPQNVTVLAAASLTAAFQAMAAPFHRLHPEDRLDLEFAGSQVLAAQIAGGAPGDVFASADTATMARVVAAGQAAGKPANFASNELEMIVPAHNPKSLESVRDLGRPGLLVDLCARGVPCGDYTAKMLAGAGITVTPVSQEADVKAVVTKVALGEVDAGVVYSTDVAAAGGSVRGIPIPDQLNVRASYPVVVLKDAPHAAGARAFVAFLLSPQGQAVLRRLGFAPPS